ncbi:MAG: chemotaxis protein CheD [Treponema sp.]|nr:chemotaxis protein CheD [Candidatus Treponema equifaecale]
MNSYFDNHFKKNVITIYPGEYYTSTGDEMVSTVLGSCVSVALCDEEKHIGGLNHFMLARDCSIEGQEADVQKLPGKYGEYAINLLIEDLVKKGADRSNLTAKVFGGSNIFNQENAQVGEVNARYAFETLAKLGIPVLKHDTGGNFPRKIFLDPALSKVYMKYVQNSHVEMEEVQKREKTMFSDLNINRVKNLFPEDIENL